VKEKVEKDVVKIFLSRMMRPVMQAFGKLVEARPDQIAGKVRFPPGAIKFSFFMDLL
jgi:hypothetical protein